MKFLIRWLITSLSIAAAVLIVPGIRIEGTTGWWAVIVMALVLGLLNAVLRPILAMLSCGFIVLTMGLFIFVVNGAVFLASSWVAVNWLNIGFFIDGIWPAIMGSIVVSVVSFVLSLLLVDRAERKSAI